MGMGATRPISIVYTTSAWAYGGAELYQSDLARASLARGWRAGVVMPADEVLDEWSSQLESTGVSVVRYKREDLKTGRLVQAAAKLNADLVHANCSWIPGDYRVMASAAPATVPRVMTEHLYACYLPSEPSLLGYLRTRAELKLWREKRRQFRQCSHIITVNERDRRRFITNWRLKPSFVTCVYNGVDPERFAGRREARRNLEAALGEPVSQTVVLAVGRPEPQKGFDLLLEALAGLTNRPWQLVLVGDGPDLQPLRNQAKQLGFADRARFLGHRNDVPQLLAGGDLFVMPSRNEAMPYSLLEALASGLPTVAAAAGGIGEVLGDSEFGLVVPTEDVPALRQAIGRLLEDPAQRERLSVVARQRIDSAFTKARMVNATLDIYRDVLRQSRPQVKMRALRSSWA